MSHFRRAFPFWGWRGHVPDHNHDRPDAFAWERTILQLMHFFPSSFVPLSHAKTKEDQQRFHVCTHLCRPLGVHDTTGVRNSCCPQTMCLENQNAQSPSYDHDQVRRAPIIVHGMCTDIRARTKLRSSYDDSVKAAAAMDSTQPARIHREEFQHAALTLALAITNSCKCLF